MAIAESVNFRQYVEVVGLGRTLIAVIISGQILAASSMLMSTGHLVKRHTRG